MHQSVEGKCYWGLERSERGENKECYEHNLITPHTQCERGKVIGVGAHIICLYVCGQKKLNRTLAIDSSFQTFAVGLLVEFID